MEHPIAGVPEGPRPRRITGDPRPVEHLWVLRWYPQSLRAPFRVVNSTELSSPLVSYPNTELSHKTHIPQPQLHHRLPLLRT